MIEKNIKIIEKYFLYAIVFLLPIVFTTLFQNPFAIVKIGVLTLGVCLGLLFLAVKILGSGKLDINVSNFDFPLTLVALATLLSAIFISPNKPEAFLLPGSATILIASYILYLLINQLNLKDKEGVIKSISVSGALIAFTSALAISGILGKINVLPEFLKQSSFTSMGGNLPVVIFLSAILVSILKLIITEKTLIQKTIFSVVLGVVTIGLLVNIYHILPGKPNSPKFPGFTTDWAIAFDTLKNTPLMGIGPGNYLTAFNRFRPIDYNMTDLWSIKFSNSRSFVIGLITETGLIGMAGLILLFLSVFRHYQNNVKKDISPEGLIDLNFIGLLILIALLVLFPATTELTMLLFVFFALNSKVKNVVLNLSAYGVDSQRGIGQYVTSKIAAILVTIPIIIISILTLFFTVKGARAEYTYKQALNALAANDGAKTYDLLRSAIAQYPTIDRYHATFSQVNLAIANSVATQATANQAQDTTENQPAELSEEQRKTITQLIQQAIAEGKTTVSLNPQKADAWEVLANIYRQIIAFAEGSDQFAIQSYSQAIALDPVNTNLRLSLGGIYFALGDFESAIDTFKLAVLTKPNHANARYNLAVAYREKGDIEKAIAEMTNVLSLVDRNSNDYELVKTELEALEAKKPPTDTTQTGENLTPPQPAEQPVVEPPIELPEGAQPPTPEVAPVVSPTPTSEASPTPTPLP